MLGLPLKLAIDTIKEHRGDDFVARVLAEAGIPADRVYRLNEPYPEEEARRLTTAAFQYITLDQMAEHFFTDSLARFPKWFEMCKTSRQFLEMQPVIHNTFAVGLQRPEEREAVREKFHLEKLADELVVHYRSPNRLCDMYKAIARHVFHHYGENGTIDEPKCLKRGDSECELRVRWT